MSEGARAAHVILDDGCGDLGGEDGIGIGVAFGKKGFYGRARDSHLLFRDRVAAESLQMNKNFDNKKSKLGQRSSRREEDRMGVPYIRAS